MKAGLKAHHWHICAMVELTLAVVGLLSRTSLVQLPFLQETIPARLLIAIGSVVTAVTPLLPVLPSLSPTLVREPLLRTLRVPGVIGLATLGYAPSTIGADAGSASLDTVFFLALLAIAILSVVIVGDFAWAIVLGFGFTALLVDTAPMAPITRTLALLGPVTTGSAVVLSGAVCAWRGPYTSRS